MERLKQRRSDEGFTLIELLIVIIILAILAAIVVFAVGTTTGNAQVAACNSTVKTVETGIEAYKAQTGHYPTTLAKLTTTTATGGPWLRSLPYGGTGGKLVNHKYAIVASSTLSTTGKITVLTGTPTTPTNHTADMATSCAGA